jgi:hypothetical protein
MTDETKSLADIAQTGWFIAIAAATWGIVLRWLVGRHNSANQRLDSRLSQLEQDVNQIKVSLASIAGRMLERDTQMRSRWNDP